MREELSLLQQNVLERYQKLAQVLHSLDNTLKQFNDNGNENVSSEVVLQQIREIEVKIGLVGTLLKGSVYSLVLQRRQELERNEIV
ncbi:hypothetical protein HG537_0G03390 [Torulaspora globosa]|uniref:DASH complex subunit DAD3 n=1 Tax=Torulaspora globosa TaxID=48254 RepID=A0A7H9HWI0_9SACH|nr:hypothetical protein HG537_0G03390 [Torulaspora sp. CBS 2947]